MTVRLVVVSDTHIPDFAARVPRPVLRAAARADLILHAGDVTSTAVLDELSELAPLRVALGNNDGEDVAAWGAQPEVHVEVGGVGVAMLHVAGPSKGRESRLRRRFPHAGLVVFGHSHIPIDAEVDGLRLLNPGSPTWKRRQPVATFATVSIEEGRVRARIEEVSG